MKSQNILVLTSAVILTGCAAAGSKPHTASAIRSAPTAPCAAGKSAVDGKSSPGAADDLDTYADTAPIADPLQPVNRVTFWINHRLYTYALRPISKGYEFLMPEKGREAVYNAYENVKFPVRLANNLLQAKFKQVGQETGAFLVNSVAGIGGLGRPARHIPALADIPNADTAQTLAKWGIPNGFYIVIPVIGPSTARDTVGLAGDWALNPITWCGFFVFTNDAWFVAVPSVNTLRSVPPQLAAYEAATKDTIDPYIAVRSAYIQLRNEVNAK